jgi:pentatricopeptide repeat protein
MQQVSFSQSALQALTGVLDAVGTELALFALFCAGFVLFRLPSVQKFLFETQKVKGKGNEVNSHDQSAQWLPAKELEANWAAGKDDVVLRTWSSVKQFTPGAMKAVVEALSAANRTGEVVGIMQSILAANAHLRNTDCLNEVLQVVQKANPKIENEVRCLFVKHSHRVRRGHSTESEPQTGQSSEKSAAHAHAVRVRSAVQGRQPEKAVQLLLAMHEGGHAVPAACVVSVVRLLRECCPEADVLQDLPDEVLCSDAVGALLDHAVRVGDALLLREVHLRVTKNDLTLTTSSREVLLRGYSALGDSRAVEVFDEMVDSGFEPSESMITAVVSLCAESRHVQMAEHAVSYIRSTSGTVSLAMYSALMKVYGHARLYHKTCGLYDAMKRDGVEADTVIYGSLIKAAVESGRLELARQLFRESGNPDLLNYMSLIRAAGRERDVQKALMLLEELEQSPMSVDNTAYNCVLEVCVACNDRVAAEGLLRRMEKAGQVDVISYNTYLKVLLNEGLREDVAAVLKEMQSRGLKPNAVTYNSLIKDVVARQDLQGAWRLIDEMEKEGIRPDAFTCSILMKGVKHTSCPEDVDRIITLIERAKVTPDEVLVNCLLDACVRLRNVQRLTQVLEQFKATGVVPSLHACATLIRAYGHARRLDRAWVLWRELTEDRKVTPNEEVFASMVDACLANGDLDGAVSVFREMKLALPDFSRGAVVFSALVKACVQRKLAKLATEVYDEIKDVCTCSKVTYNTLIDALVRQGEMDRATDLFRDMSLKGVTPDLITYSTLIKGHCVRGDLEQGLQLLGLMQRRGIAPDAILFNSILDGCAHKQMCSLTEMVLKDMEAAGIAPSNFTLSILVKLYGRCNDLEMAFKVVDTYPPKYGFDLNAQVYTCLMSACIANGELARAIHVYERMTKAGCASDAKTYQTLLSGCLRHDDLDNATRLVGDALRRDPPLCLDRDVVESVLFMAARRGRGTDLGLPLLEQLEQAGVSVSERISNTLRRGDELGPDPRDARPYVRRSVRNQSM